MSPGPVTEPIPRTPEELREKYRGWSHTELEAAFREHFLVYQAALRQLVAQRIARNEGTVVDVIEDEVSCLPSNWLPDSGLVCIGRRKDGKHVALFLTENDLLAAIPNSGELFWLRIHKETRRPR